MTAQQPGLRRRLMMYPCASRWEAYPFRRGARRNLRVAKESSPVVGQRAERLVRDVELPDLSGWISK